MRICEYIDIKKCKTEAIIKAFIFQTNTEINVCGTCASKLSMLNRGEYKEVSFTKL